MSQTGIVYGKRSDQSSKTVNRAQQIALLLTHHASLSGITNVVATHQHSLDIFTRRVNHIQTSIAEQPPPMKRIDPNINEFFLAEDYANAASAENTKLAYGKDIDRFVAWGGKIPTNAEQISAYIAEHATTHKPATLSRWIAAISVAHQKAGFDSPTHGIEVRHTLRGVKRKVGTKQRRVEPLTLEMATAIVDKLPESLAAKRDKAIVLIGFSAAMRRSEVIRLKVEDLTDDVRGIVLDF